MNKKSKAKLVKAAEKGICTTADFDRVSNNGSLFVSYETSRAASLELAAMKKWNTSIYAAREQCKKLGVPFTAY